MLTPEQAGQHVCPFLRKQCEADRCLMWRWGETTPEIKDQVVELRVAHVGGGVTTEKRVQRVPVEVPHRGFCGLAGWPNIKGGTP